MKSKKTLVRIFVIVLVVGLMLGIGLTTKVEKDKAQYTPEQDVIAYLDSKLKQQNVPVMQIRSVKKSPVEIEVTIQSLSEDDKFMPEDFINLHLVTREAVLAQEKGYYINGLTEIVVNNFGETIDWGWNNIADITYIKLTPSVKPNDLPMGFISENINAYGMILINEDVSLFEGFQTLNLQLSIKSLEEANQKFPQFKESLRSIVVDSNFSGTQVIMERIELRDEKGEILLNYLLDIQFKTEGWWAVDGFNTDSLRFSVPPPEDSVLPTQIPPSTEIVSPTP